MKWQKAARVVVAAVGVSTAAAVYFLMHERTPQGPPPVLNEADPAAKMQSGSAQYVRRN